ncbi:MAG: four helix bundle protein [Planctomycetota bacterium]
MQDFRRLRVWRKAHQLALSVYRQSAGFPRDEEFGLRVQIRRAGSSVPTNLAEGCGRGSDADFARFVQMAMGSASELEYLVYLAMDLGYFDQAIGPSLLAAADDVKRMLAGLLSTLAASARG